MRMKDWTGNKATTFATLGASNHSETERAENETNFKNINNVFNR